MFLSKTEKLAVLIKKTQIPMGTDLGKVNMSIADMKSKKSNTNMSEEKYKMTSFFIFLRRD